VAVHGSVSQEFAGFESYFRYIITDAQLDAVGADIVFDFGEGSPVNIEVIRFTCESHEIQPLNCPPTYASGLVMRTTDQLPEDPSGNRSNSSSRGISSDERSRRRSRARHLAT